VYSHPGAETVNRLEIEEERLSVEKRQLEIDERRLKLEERCLFEQSYRTSRLLVPPS